MNKLLKTLSIAIIIPVLMLQGTLTPVKAASWQRASPVGWEIRREQKYRDFGPAGDWVATFRIPSAARNNYYFYSSNLWVRASIPGSTWRKVSEGRGQQTIEITCGFQARMRYPPLLLGGLDFWRRNLDIWYFT
jgi:hypothetical protein